MAEAAPTTSDGLEEGLEPTRTSGRKIVAIGGLVLLLLAALGGGAVVLFGGGAKDEASEAGKAEEAQAEPKTLIFYDLPEMVVNLNTGGRQPRYLRTKITLELERESARAELEKKLPRVIDDFQVYLRELRVEDLSGSEGLYRLKTELMARINRSAAPATVTDVLFREMLVQ